MSDTHRWRGISSTIENPPCDRVTCGVPSFYPCTGTAQADRRVFGNPWWVLFSELTGESILLHRSPSDTFHLYFVFSTTASLSWGFHAVWVQFSLRLCKRNDIVPVRRLLTVDAWHIAVISELVFDVEFRSEPYLFHERERFVREGFLT